MRRKPVPAWIAYIPVGWREWGRVVPGMRQGADLVVPMVAEVSGEGGNRGGAIEI